MGQAGASTHIAGMLKHHLACLPLLLSPLLPACLPSCFNAEIYNETITDLLDPSRTNLQVRENLEGQYVSNLTAHDVYRGELSGS